MTLSTGAEISARNAIDFGTRHDLGSPQPIPLEGGLHDYTSTVAPEEASSTAQGWQKVYRLLKEDGYSVSLVQNPTLSREATPLRPRAWSTRRTSR